MQPTQLFGLAELALRQKAQSKFHIDQMEEVIAHVRLFMWRKGRSPAAISSYLGDYFVVSLLVMTGMGRRETSFAIPLWVLNHQP